MTNQPVPRSRRDRPAKPPLSRQWIVDTTIEIMRKEGLGKATMRRVAHELDTGPASLYVYVRNTAELHGAVLDALLGELPQRTEGAWDERIEALLTDYRGLLFANPGLARSVLVIRPAGENFIAMVDRLLGLLIEGGVNAGQASWGVNLLLLSTTATAAEHAASEPGDVDGSAEIEHSAQGQAVRGAGGVSTPHINEHADSLLGGTPDQRWQWAVRAQIAGIAATPQPLPQPEPEPEPPTNKE